jgi:hypothetical protein
MDDYKFDKENNWWIKETPESIYIITQEAIDMVDEQVSKEIERTRNLG